MGAWCLQVSLLTLAISFDNSRSTSFLIIRAKKIESQNSSLTGSGDSEMSEEQKKEKLSELRKKEHEIQDILARKTKELKKICLREAVREHFLF